MGISWKPSADKHGVDRADALNAIQNYIYRLESFDEPRAPSVRRPDLFIGPTRDSHILLEVMVVMTPPSDIMIFHVMPARRKILDIAERNNP